MTPEVILQTSKQITAELLCSLCEDRFSRMGENYVIRNSMHGPESFPIGDLLDAAPPEFQDKDGAFFAVDSLPDLDVEKLVYFGSSVFWRAAARRWKIGRFRSIHLRLGAYEEDFRRYLLGDSLFPDRAAIHMFVARKRSAPFIASPCGAREGSCYMHTFAVPGLQFIMYVGKQIPESVRSVSLSDGGVVFLMDLEDGFLFRNAGRAMSGAHVSRKLAASR